MDRWMWLAVAVVLIALGMLGYTARMECVAGTCGPVVTAPGGGR